MENTKVSKTTEELFGATGAWLYNEAVKSLPEDTQRLLLAYLNEAYSSGKWEGFKDGAAKTKAIYSGTRVIPVQEARPLKTAHA